MRLDKITLAGFKSFPDRTTLKVSSGIIAVVGPNGCGKSNIVDAFRWVMGESRATQLRQENNEAIIFNGASGRRSSDLCSVELNLLNDGSKDIGMWSDYSELSVRREVERDGDSTYFINGQRVRRKDVVDVFAGTGMGARSYGIVEQERVTQIVRAEPKRIREHLEEAAGVTQYKARRKETESRIGVSQANLARIDDTVAELKRQMDSLVKQARQTERIRREKKRLSAARLLLLQMRHEQLDKGHREAREAAEQAKKSVDESRQKCKDTEKELEQARKQRNKRSETLNKFQAKHFEAMADLEKARQSLREFEAGVASDKTMLEEADQAIKEQSDKTAELEETVTSISAEIKSCEEAIRKSSEELALTKKQLDLAARKVDEARTNLDAARAELNKARQQESGASSALQLAQHRLENLDEVVDTAKADLKNLAPVESPDLVHLEKLRSELTKAIDEAVSNERNRQELGEQIAAAKEEAARLQGVKGGLLAERDLLKRVSGKQSDHFSSWLADKGLPDAKRIIDETDIKAPGIERAVDVALSTFLKGYVVPDVNALLEAEKLPAGMVLFEKTPNEGQVSGNRVIDGVRPLIECIKCADSWRGVITRWLDGVYLAADHASALEARAVLRNGEKIVTPDGVCIEESLVHVASDQEVGIEWRSRLDEVEQGLAKVEGDIDAHSANVVKMAARHEQLLEAGGKLAAKRREVEDRFEKRNQEAIRLGHAYEYREEQIKRLNGVIEKALQESNLRKKEQEQVVASHKDALAKSKKAEGDLEHTEKEHSTAVVKASDLRETFSKDEAALHRQELSLEHQKQRRDETKERIVEAQVNLSNHRVRIVEIQARMRGRSSDKLEQDLDKANGVVSETKKELDEEADRTKGLERSELDFETKLVSLRQVLEQAEANLRELEISTATKKVEADGISAQIQAQQDEAEHADSLRKEYSDEQSVSGLVERVEQRIERAGPINYAAEAELSACETRLGEVSEQREDLATALDALKEAIGRIDAEMLERLKDVHSKLQTGFDAMFKRLFDGGEARVELVGDDLLSAGLQLRATPPGKNVSTIQSLSGGEKTLTAIAFLFALNELNPPSFCILDEVDAALDEPNTVRLFRLIESMADRVQFVIVTHNKQVIERADRLVGVTQHSKGVSCLVSVHVDQALEQARAAAAGGA